MIGIASAAARTRPRRHTGVRGRPSRLLGWLVTLLRGDDSQSRAVEQRAPTASTIQARGAGDPDPHAAVDALYLRHAPAVLAYLAHHLPGMPDAEDALADVFLAALRSSASGRVPDLPWLLLVARRRIADYYRAHERTTLLLSDKAGASFAGGADAEPEALALLAEERRELLALVAQLPEDQREVLSLRFAAGLRSPAIASLLGKTDEAVRAMLSRAVRRLRKEWQR